MSTAEILKTRLAPSQEGAFFIPSIMDETLPQADERLHVISADLYNRNHELMPDGLAHLAQFTMRQCGVAEPLPITGTDGQKPIFTLVFDASHRRNCAYDWELIRSHSGQRKVAQIYLDGRNRTRGYTADYNAQGQLHASRELEHREVLALAQTIGAVVTGSVIGERLRTLQAVRRHEKHGLEELGRTGIITVKTATGHERSVQLNETTLAKKLKEGNESMRRLRLAPQQLVRLQPRYSQEKLI